MITTDNSQTLINALAEIDRLKAWRSSEIKTWKQRMTADYSSNTPEIMDDEIYELRAALAERDAKIESLERDRVYWVAQSDGWRTRAVKAECQLAALESVKVLDERDASLQAAQAAETYWLEKLKAMTEKLAALEKSDRHIRRLLCVAVAKQPYMDDGEASDQEIDYLREPPADIERKLQERGRNLLAAAPKASNERLIKALAGMVTYVTTHRAARANNHYSQDAVIEALKTLCEATDNSSFGYDYLDIMDKLNAKEPQ